MLQLIFESHSSGKNEVTKTKSYLSNIKCHEG